MVVPADLCWGLTAEAQQVVIMGTQYYDGSAGSGGTDYPVTDLLQMMGRAIRRCCDSPSRNADARLHALQALPRRAQPAPSNAQSFEHHSCATACMLTNPAHMSSITAFMSRVGPCRCRCMLLCHAPKKAYYKKFLFEPFPVESHLDAFLHDHLAAEVRFGDDAQV
jgi:hypothetical protein